MTAKKIPLSSPEREHHHLGEVRLALGQRPEADEDHQQQAGQLDQGQHHVEPDALPDAAEVHQRDEQHEAQRDQGDAQAADRQVEAEAVVDEARERVGGGGRRGDAGAHHREGDQEGQEVHPERLVRVERCPGCLRVAGDQLEVGHGGDGGHHEGDQERCPGGTAHLTRDLPGQRVDAGPQDVADDEEQQQRGPHHALEVRLAAVVVGTVVLDMGAHGLPFRSVPVCTPSVRTAKRCLGLTGRRREARGRLTAGGAGAAAAPPTHRPGAAPRPPPSPATATRRRRRPAAPRARRPSRPPRTRRGGRARTPPRPSELSSRRSGAWAGPASEARSRRPTEARWSATEPVSWATRWRSGPRPPPGGPATTCATARAGGRRRR